MSASTSQHVITVNDEKGKATFYKWPRPPLARDRGFGIHTTVYTNPSMPVNISHIADADLDSTAEHSQTGLTNGRVCVDNGIHTCTLTIKPGEVTGMHRTRTLDMGVVLEGEVELELDDGEKVVLKRGDTYVQRGTIHRWRTSTAKDTTVFCTLIDAQPIIGADGNEMEEVWLQSG